MCLPENVVDLSYFTQDGNRNGLQMQSWSLETKLEQETTTKRRIQTTSWSGMRGSSSPTVLHALSSSLTMPNTTTVVEKSVQ